jgi:methylthioribose-1-phosphate isomerase
LKKAHNDKKNIHVYNDETRPLYQGRTTSKDLVEAGIPNTMVTDGSSSFFVDNIYESHVHIDKVIIGCDSVRIN